VTDAVPSREPVPGSGSVTERVIRIEGLRKAFGGTLSLIDVDLEIAAGEIHALVGQNGAGKSTLIKILSGFHAADDGTAELLGDPLDLHSATGERDPRMRFLHQDLGLIQELSALDNLALRGGYARRLGGLIDWRAQADRAREMLARFDLRLDVNAPLSRATPVQRTVVALAGVLQDWDESGRGLLVLDEPTAVLPPHEVKIFLDIVRSVRDRGVAVLYVSHRLDELQGLADRITVLRGGRRVATQRMSGLDSRRIASLMLGQDVEAEVSPVGAHVEGRPLVLEARALGGRELISADIRLREGEIVGVAGLVGSGRDELPYVLAGLVSRARGEVRIGGGEHPWVAASRVKTDVALVPADRNHEGVIAEYSVTENLTLPVLDRLRRGPFLSRRQEDAEVTGWMTRLDVRASSAAAPIRTLSGGNQQKIVLARCLARRPRVLCLCEPTAGVDIGTRQAIHRIVADQAAAGLTVVVSSSDVSDLYAMCTRVLVLRNGRIVGELSGRRLTEASILHAMEGQERIGGDDE